MRVSNACQRQLKATLPPMATIEQPYVVCSKLKDRCARKASKNPAKACVRRRSLIRSPQTTSPARNAISAASTLLVTCSL